MRINKAGFVDPFPGASGPSSRPGPAGAGAYLIQLVLDPSPEASPYSRFPESRNSFPGGYRGLSLGDRRLHISILPTSAKLNKSHPRIPGRVKHTSGPHLFLTQIPLKLCCTPGSLITPQVQELPSSPVCTPKS